MPVIEDERAEARRMRDEEGLSERAIAAALGRSNSTIHKWLSETPDEPDPDPIPGQQTIDGHEIPAAQNGNGPHIEEIRVDGTTQLGLIDFGGKQPQSATLRLTGGEYELLEGRAFQKGDVVRFSGTAVVDFVGGKDKTDRKTGIVVSAKQKHTAYITDLIVTGAE
jgi:hypothetical protein